MVLRSFLGCLLLALLPAFALAQKPAAKSKSENEDHFKKWLTQDVLYIITDDEKAVFQKLTTPEEKEQFIEQFWARRDPDPRTTANEFKEEHYRRIAYANEHFTSGDPGWMTDRGRVFILHGPPDGKESRPAGGVYARPIEEGGGITQVHPYEKWRYRYIEGLGPDVELEFVDPTGTGEFRLAVFPWEKDAFLHVGGMGNTLAENSGRATRADRPGLMPGAGGAGMGPESMYMRAKDVPFARYETIARAAAPPTKYKVLKEQVQVKVGFETLPFDVRSHYVRLNDAQVLVPISVQIPNQNLTFKTAIGAHVARLAVFGTVTNLAGRIVSEFEDEFVTGFRADDATGMQKSSIYQHLVTLPAGMRYKVELIVKDLGSTRMGVVQHSIAPPKFDGQTLAGSSLILANVIQPLQSIPTGNPMFVLGDVKVVPKLDKRFTPATPLGVYLQVYNAALDQQTLTPSLRVVFTLFRDGRALKAATDEKGESTQFSSGLRTVLIKELSLEGLEPGPYKIQVEVTDAVTGQKVAASETFEVVPDARTARSDAR
jgi:GWxTD domain-containing protein